MSLLELMPELAAKTQPRFAESLCYLLMSCKRIKAQPEFIGFYIKDNEYNDACYFTAPSMSALADYLEQVGSRYQIFRIFEDGSVVNILTSK